MELTAFLNGQYLPLSRCNISVMDVGITNAASVTDFIRTFNHKIFRLEDHVDRFFKAAKNAYLEIPYTKEEVYEISRTLIEKNAEMYPECEFGMCFYVTPGVNYAYAGSAMPAGRMTPTYCQHVFPEPIYTTKPYYTEGVHMVTTSVPHIPPQCVSPKGKHRNRLHMWVGDHIVHSMDPNAMAVFLDQFGNITETGGSNVVIYRDGKITIVTVTKAMLEESGVGEDDLDDLSGLAGKRQKLSLVSPGRPRMICTQISAFGASARRRANPSLNCAKVCPRRMRAAVASSEDCSPSSTVTGMRLFSSAR